MNDSSESELKYWLGFNQVKGIGPAKFKLLLNNFGTLSQAWSASQVQLEATGLDKRAINSLIESRNTLNLDSELAKIISAGIHLITLDSNDYPKYLKEIPNPPPVLYIRGEIMHSDQWAVAIVGTRNLSAYGRQITYELALGLSRSGVTIISGLARGIDSVAHKAALDGGGRTLAVLGSGLDNIYPPENRKLADQICANHGALISEYGLGVKPEPQNFPPRNRIISGLALGVIIVEAGQRSGALITADFALEQGREVFAVPGNINNPKSKGTNQLIQGGAKLVSCVEDVLEELNLTMLPEHAAVQVAVPDTAEEAILLTYLSSEPIHIDDLIRQLNLPSGLVSSTLTVMELKGLVQQVGGMRYVLIREAQNQYGSSENEE